VQVKLLAQDGELYIFAASRDRVAKERAMRRRRLKKLWRRLDALRQQRLRGCESFGTPRVELEDGGGV
jgi:hypothetical protein